MKNTTCLLLTSVILAGISPSSVRIQAASIPGLFNTGVDNTGSVLSVGSAEAHYALTGTLSNAIVIQPAYYGSGNIYNWVTPPSGSAWIGPLPSSQTAPVSNYGYVYTTSFDLTGLDTSTVNITGSIACDDNARIVVNSVDLGYTIGAGTHLTSFSITNNFLPGTNVLQFRVSNATGETGLLIANLAGTATRLNPAASIRVSAVDVCWLSASNLLYEVDYRSTLMTNLWLPLYTNLTGTGQTMCITDGISVGQPQRFYRVICVSP